MKYIFAVLVLLAFNLTAVAPAHAASGTTSTVTTAKLAETDSLNVLVDEIATEWSDGNITSGTSSLSAIKISSALPTTDDGWKDLVKDLFIAEVKDATGGDLPKETKLRLTSSVMKPKYLKLAFDAFAEGNAMDMTMGENEFTQGIAAQIKKVVEALGDAKDVQALTVKARIMDDGAEELRTVRLHAFVNKKDSKAVMIFTVEGTM